MAEQTLDAEVGDFKVTLRSGEGIWLEVHNPEGKRCLIHIVHQVGVGDVRVEAQNPDAVFEFDEPLGEFTVDFQ